MFIFYAMHDFIGFVLKVIRYEGLSIKKRWQYVNTGYR